MKDYSKYFYKQLSEPRFDRYADNVIKQNKDVPLWYISLYFSKKRLAKYQRETQLFWDGCDQDFNRCKTEDLHEYNGFFTFDEAFEIFKNFKLKEGELIRLNFKTKNYSDGLILVRSE